MERTTIGSFLAVLRKAAGMTQRDLAERLNVSDKTVSRWERDEGTPDLALIPVLAELFGVTSDELLRGQRAPAGQPPRPDSAAKTEKQQQRLLAVSLSKYKNHSFLAMGLSGCGLVAAMLGNLAFLRAYLGFFMGAVFFLAAVVVQLVCANAAMLAVSDEELAGPSVAGYKRAVLRWAQGSITVGLCLFAATLPLILAGDAHYGLTAGSFFLAGLLCGAVALVLCAVTAYFVNWRLFCRGVYPLEEAAAQAYRRNFRLKRTCSLVLVATLLVTGLLHFGLTTLTDVFRLAQGTSFDNFDDFKAYMEQDIPADYGDPSPAPPEPVGPVTYYDEHGNAVSQEQALTRTITDRDGKVVCEYLERNQSVWSIRYGGKDGQLLPITVSSREQVQAAYARGTELRLILNIAFLAVYTLELLGTVLLYRRKRAK